MSTRKAALLMSVFSAALMAGCGKVDLATVDPTRSASTGTPIVANNPVVVDPTPAPAPAYNPPLAMGKLTVVVKDFKGGILGITSKSIKVDVKNPTQVPLKGTVTIAWTNSGKANGKTESKTVDVEPGATQELDFKYGWSFSVDGASASVVTEGGEGAVPTGGAILGQPAAGAASIYGSPPKFNY